MKCAQCGFENPAGFSFCGNCGSRLLTPPPTATQTVTEERKVVTIMFADIAGSTALAERLDPERVRAIMGRYFETTAAVVHRFGGTIEKFIGDEVMAVFGLPASHEDDPERAVRAAATMHQRLADLNAELRLPGDSALQMRVGINTGEVIADPHAVHTGEFMVTGDAVNVAARLRSAAAPGTTLVGERTYRQAQRVAEFRERAPFAAKGKAELVRGWELLGLRSEPEVRRVALRAPLVGREREFALLQDVLDSVVRERTPQLVTIIGAPGVGKSRLFEELAAAHPDVTVRQGRSLPYAGTPLGAMGEIIRADCGILRSDPHGVMDEKLRSRISALLSGGEVPGEAAQVLAQLSRVLAIGSPPDRLSEADSRDTLFWALRRYVEAVARSGPLVLGFEDLHSADAELLDVVEYISVSGAGLPLLLICLARPELLDRRPGWGHVTPRSTVLPLTSLPEGATAVLVARFLNAPRAPDDLSAVLNVAGGNPFFIEEILRTLLDGGSLTRNDTGWQVQTPLEVRIPDTVQGVVASRLDQLGRSEKAVLLEAAVLGEECWLGALADLTRTSEDSLSPVLQTLIEKDYLLERAQSRLEGQREYTFTHLIVRDAAYNLLPKARRAERHAAFGRWLEQTLAERAEEFAELLAHHWQQALQLTRELGDAGWREIALSAIRFALIAGRRAARVYAHEQAIAQFETARALAEEIGEDAERIGAVEGLADVYAMQAQWDKASALYGEALDFHQRKGDAIRQARVQSRIASTYSGVFDFRQALPHIQSAMAKLDPGRHTRELAGLYVQMARTQAYLGNLAAADQFAQRGLLLVAGQGPTAEIADARIVHGMIHALLGHATAAEHFGEALRIAEEADEPVRIIAACNGRAFLHRQRGEYAAALTDLHRALSIADRIQLRPRIAQCCAFLGDLYFLTGTWPTATEYFRRYLTFGEEVPSWTENARSILAFTSGQLEAACEWSQRAVDRSERRRDIAELGMDADWHATILLRLGRWGEAAGFLDEACKRFGTLGVLFPAFLHPLGAEAELRRGNLAAAREHCAQAETYESIAWPPAAARLARAKGLIAAAEDRWDDAAGQLRRAVEVFRSIGQLYDQALALEDLAAIHLRRGGFDDQGIAQTLHAEAVALYRQIGADFEERRLRVPKPA